MAAKEGVPPCSACSFKDWKASTYDKSKFEGTWVAEGDCNSPVCCGKACVVPHCCCYTCVFYYVLYMPILPDLTWTCGDNCWLSQGGSLYIYGEGDVVYHQWCCCPFEKWVRAGGAVGAPASEMMER